MEIVGLYFSDWGLDLYGLALFTSEKVLRERREALRRWTEATTNEFLPKLFPKRPAR